MSTHKIGAHVSAAGGIDQAIVRAAEIGCNCVQIFSGSPRIWRRPPLESQAVDKLFAAQEKYQIMPVFTHALYLVNLASDKPDNVQKSIDSIMYELKFDALIKGAGVIVHLGSHTGRGWEAVKHQVAATLIDILEHTPGDSTLLIENSAGQKGKICSDLSEIRWLLDEVKSDRLGWCLDTCHAHAAGYPLSPTSDLLAAHPDAKEKILTTVIAELDLWSSLKVIHVNDSRDPFASGRDRHDNLGDGSIPSEDFHYFLNLSQTAQIPFILEVPGIDGNGPDASNVKRLQALLE